MLIRLTLCLWPYTPGQLAARQRQSDLVGSGIGDIREPIEKPQGVQHGRIDADTYCMVAGFDALQCFAGRKRAVGNDRGREVPPAAGVADVTTQLPECTPDSVWGPVGSGHNCYLPDPLNQYNESGR